MMEPLIPAQPSPEPTTSQADVRVDRQAGADTMADAPGAPTTGTAEFPADLANHARYRVLRTLGKGGMGTVFLAEHRLMRRQVALKVINPALVASLARRERFHREIETAARLLHPNIVEAYDAEQAGTTHFLAMEYVEGRTLAEVLAESGRLPVGQACEYIRQAALGLQHAYESGLVHRDIKPANLMLTPQGQVKILDFGLARLERDGPGLLETRAPEPGEAERGLTFAGEFMGTADYIAPEQIKDASQAGPQADIYSLGCTLFHLLAGEPPFPGTSIAEKLAGHEERAPQALAGLRPDVPRGLLRVMDRMMAKDPLRRYQISAEVARDLGRYAAPLSQARARRRLLLGFSTTLVAGLLLAVGVVLTQATSNPIEELPNIEPAPVQIAKNGAGDGGLEKNAKTSWDSLPEGLATRPFPGRALLISANDYSLADALHYGRPSRPFSHPGSSTGAIAEHLLGPEFNMHPTQVIELSDGGGANPNGTLKPAIESTISQFLDTCRKQDRIILLFAGHAVAIDKEAYLVPVEGDREDSRTLIPLKWIYDRLAKCPAWQKVLILDVCRLPKARLLREGSGPMSNELAAAVQNPPAGIQVWTSCVAGKYSVELADGSVFMRALCSTLQDGVPGIGDPANALPMEAMVVRVNEQMKELLASEGRAQTSRLAGKSPGSAGPYDPAETLPTALSIAVPEGKRAAANVLADVLIEIERIPGGVDQHSPSGYLPRLTRKALQHYVTSEPTLRQLAQEDPGELDKLRERFPLRTAVVDTIKVLDETYLVRKDYVGNGDGELTAQIKAEYLKEATESARTLATLKKQLKKLQDLEAKRGQETSARWQATFDFTMARLMMRLAFTSEYALLLGKVGAGDLPKLNRAAHTGWRLTSRPKNLVETKEPQALDTLEKLDRRWKKILKDHPDTPWALVAKRDSEISLGLEWLPSRQPGKRAHVPVRIPTVDANVRLNTNNDELRQIESLRAALAKALLEDTAAGPDLHAVEGILKDKGANENQHRDLYPVRIATVEAIHALDDNAIVKTNRDLFIPLQPAEPAQRIQLYPTGAGCAWFSNAWGSTSVDTFLAMDGHSATRASRFFTEQKELGLGIHRLRQALAKLEAGGNHRSKETSTRWRAHHDYTFVRLLSGLVYLHEYSCMLGRVRDDDLPKLDPAIHKGWRLCPSAEVQVREFEVRFLVKHIRDRWRRIINDYPNTPWASIAEREKLIPLGLTWRPSPGPAD